MFTRTVEEGNENFAVGQVYKITSSLQARIHSPRYSRQTSKTADGGSWGSLQYIGLGVGRRARLCPTLEPTTTTTTLLADVLAAGPYYGDS